MNQDFIPGIVIVVALAVLIWLIRHAVRTGRWRYRGGIAYREKSPKLFWGIVALACAMGALVAFMLFVMLNHHLYCNAKGTPGACFEKLIHAW